MVSPRIILIATLLALPVSGARADTYVVTDTNGHTLLWAITNANTHAGPDSIHFNLPGAGTHSFTSSYSNPLGLADDETVLDGYTQPGSSPNSGKLGQPWNAIIKIALVANVPCEEASFGYFPALSVGGDRCVVRGILISDAFCQDIEVDGEDNVIEGCAFGSASPAIVVGGIRNRIGGTTPAARNVVVGNYDEGIHLGGRDARVEGNYIGIGASLGAAPNGRGIVVFGTGAIIGGHPTSPCTLPASANIIAYNKQHGISVVGDGSGCSILSNIIHSNGGLGIDLGGNGPTSNDQLDADGGANHSQNYPFITGHDNHAIYGSLDSAPNQTYAIQVFDNSSCDPIAGEGKILYGEQQVTTNGNGVAGFTVICAPIRAGRFYTATATDENGNTSEFSPCYTPTATAVGDTPTPFALHDNIPNPFNPATTLFYEVGAPGRVDLVIYDAAGHRVRTLVSEHRNIGSWRAEWNGRDDSGKRVASGVYFCKMNAGGFESTRKMVLLK